MAKISWKQLPEKLEVLRRKGAKKPPTVEEIDAALDDHEQRFGFRFPKSYREFIHWFGPGMLSCSWFGICAPIPLRLVKRVADAFNLEKEREMILGPKGYWAESVSPDKLKQFVLFTTTEGGDWFFWNTADVQDKKNREYGAYFHSHGSSAGKVTAAASSFKDFVFNIGLADTYPLSDEQREEVRWAHCSAW